MISDEWKEEYRKLLFFHDVKTLDTYSRDDILLKEKIEKSFPLLYKYQSFNNEFSLKNLENQEVYFNKPSCFNDPYDSLFNMQIEETDKDFNESFRENFRAFCLSETNSSLPMWSHYSSNHEGFCMEYDLKEWVLCNRSRFIIAPVEYVIVPVDPLVPGQTGIEKFLFVKHYDWKYEREWRIVTDKISSIVKFPKPTRLFVGTRISPCNLHKIIKLAKKIGVPLHKCIIESGSYKMRFEVHDI